MVLTYLWTMIQRTAYLNSLMLKDSRFCHRRAKNPSFKKVPIMSTSSAAKQLNRSLNGYLCCKLSRTVQANLTCARVRLIWTNYIKWRCCKRVSLALWTSRWRGKVRASVECPKFRVIIRSMTIFWSMGVKIFLVSHQESRERQIKLIYN